MIVAQSVLIGTETRLRDSSITIEELLLLRKNEDRFLDLCKVWDSYQEDTKIRQIVHLSFQACLSEVEKFEQEQRLVERFVTACVSICTPDNGGLCQELGLLLRTLKDDISSKEVRGLCHLTSEEAAAEPYFPVPLSCRQYLQPVGNAQDSHIFRRLWEEKAREVGQQRRYEQPSKLNPLMLSDITELICASVISQWRSVCHEVQNGSISLGRVSDLFGCLTNDSGALEKELNCIDVCSLQHCYCEWKQERQRQIEQYSKLREKIEAARTLKDVIILLKLSHSFKEVDIICQQVCCDIYHLVITSTDIFII